jgi:uncharacterized protein
MTSKYKILSLDGGGSWAILEAMALNDIYKNSSVGNKCKDILAQFDLVVANSGGSLALAAMLARDDMDDVINLFKDKATRDKIFSPLKFWEKSLVAMVTSIMKIGPKYKTTRKIDGLRNVLGALGDTRLENIPQKMQLPNTQFMIMCYDYDKNKATYFRSNNNSASTSKAAGQTNEITLAQAVHASSNAPINYFDEPAEFLNQGRTRRYWDGAIGGNNNPCMVGVIEAMANGNNAENIEVLSIGTGNTLLPISSHTDAAYDTYSFLVKEKPKQSLLSDVARQASTILNEPPDIASYMAHIVLGGNGQHNNTPEIVRMNALISPILMNNKWTLPSGFDPDKFKKLIALDMDAVADDEVALIEYLGNKWLSDGVKNQAIRADNNLECQIGHGKYSEAKRDWINRSGMT